MHFSYQSLTSFIPSEYAIQPSSSTIHFFKYSNFMVYLLWTLRISPTSWFRSEGLSMVLKIDTVKKLVWSWFSVLPNFWTVLELFTKPDWCSVPCTSWISQFGLVFKIRLKSYVGQNEVSKTLTNSQKPLSWCIYTLEKQIYPTKKTFLQI